MLFNGCLIYPSNLVVARFERSVDILVTFFRLCMDNLIILLNFEQETRMCDDV